jgi:hypothetical protein
MSKLLLSYLNYFYIYSMICFCFAEIRLTLPVIHIYSFTPIRNYLPTKGSEVGAAAKEEWPSSIDRESSRLSQEGVEIALTFCLKVLIRVSTPMVTSLLDLR